MKSSLIVLFLGFLLFFPLSSIAGERQELPGIVVYTNDPNPSKGYIEFSNAFNDELIRCWKTVQREGVVRGLWTVFVQQEPGPDPDGTIIIIFAVREQEGARPVPIATITPQRQFSRIAAESAAKRTMRLIIAVEAQERRGGK